MEGMTLKIQEEIKKAEAEKSLKDHILELFRIF